MKVTPVGLKILVHSLKRKESITDGGIVAIDTLEEGEIIEVSDYLKNIYSVGDVVLYPPKSGTEYNYNGKICLFLNGAEYPSGDIWAIISKTV